MSTAVRIKHLVLGLPRSFLSYHSGLNHGELLLQPTREPGTYHVNLKAGQYHDLQGSTSRGEATVQLDDGRIFAGKIVAATRNVAAETLTGPLGFCLSVMELKLDAV